VPALHINEGATPTREDAEKDCLSAIAFAPKGDPQDYHTGAETHLPCERGASSLRNKTTPQPFSHCTGAGPAIEFKEFAAAC
jgi:hypothetical protein